LLRKNSPVVVTSSGGVLADHQDILRMSLFLKILERAKEAGIGKLYLRLFCSSVVILLTYLSAVFLSPSSFS